MMNIEPDKHLTVLSLNCWGLFVVSKERKFRLQAIADYISQQDYDLVALQEVWMWSDFDTIKETTESVLPYSRYFYSGTLGSGLVLLSRFPIVCSNYVQFTLAGRPLKIFQGDFYVGKGFGSVCVDHPDIGLIDVYTTHLQAAYGNQDDYEAQRITECWQIANSVRMSAAQGRHVILAGDFNSIPTSHCYQLLKHHGFMTDSWLEMHQDVTDSQELTAFDCIQQFGITCDSPINTWSKHLLKQEPYAKDIGDRLDYIFYRRSPQLQCQSSQVVMYEPIPNTNKSYSDHFGVLSVFQITNQTSSALNSQFAPIASALAKPTTTELVPGQLKPMIRLLQKDLYRATTTANGHLFWFALSLLIVFATWTSLLIAPSIFMSMLIGLVLVLFSALAIVFLLVGFVFGKTEQRSLRQYLKDMQLYLDRLEPTLNTTHSSSASLLSPTNTSISTSDGLVIKNK